MYFDACLGLQGRHSEQVLRSKSNGDHRGTWRSKNRAGKGWPAATWSSHGRATMLPASVRIYCCMLSYMLLPPFALHQALHLPLSIRPYILSYYCTKVSYIKHPCLAYFSPKISSSLLHITSIIIPLKEIILFLYIL